MSSKQGFGSYVDTENVSSLLESTRLQRLALNVLWNELPPGTDTEPMHDALLSIHDRITEIETGELRRWGVAEHGASRDDGQLGPGGEVPPAAEPPNVRVCAGPSPPDTLGAM